MPAREPMNSWLDRVRALPRLLDCDEQLAAVNPIKNKTSIEKFIGYRVICFMVALK